MGCLNSKTIRIYLAVLAMSGTFFLTAPFAAADNVATVNGVAITDADLSFALEQFKQRMARQNQNIPEDQMGLVKERILEMIINRELMFQESKKKGLKIDAEQIEGHIDALKAKFPDAEAFQKRMQEMDTTEQGLRAEVSKEYAINQLIQQEVVQKVAVSETESRSFYDEHPEIFTDPERVKASHILVKIDPGADAQEKEKAREKIADIQKELAAGKSFDALAKKYSDCPSSAKGGELGYFKRGQMVKPFEEAAFQLKPGETSDIVETKFGYHLIKLSDKKPGGLQDYETKREKIAELLKRNKIQDAVKAYVMELRSGAEIEKF